MLSLKINPSQNNARVKLRNGSFVTIRKIVSNDAQELSAFSARLSPETKYARYLNYRRNYSEAEAAQICCTRAGVRMALIAEVNEGGDKKIVGLAEYELLSAHKAEVGVIVEDQYQGIGLGTYLLKQLVEYAIVAEITSFTALVHPENSRILHFIQKSNLPVKRLLSHGTWEFQVELECGGCRRRN